MPALIYAILASVISSFLFRITAGAGLAFYSYTKINEYMNLFINSVGQQMSRLPATFLNLLALAGFDKYLSICLSAITAAIFILSMKIFVGKSS